MSKADKLRKRRNRKNAALSAPKAAQGHQPTNTPTSRSSPPPSRPTRERQAKGDFKMPKGMGKEALPAVDMQSDRIAYMLATGQITSSQEQGARQYERVFTNYQAQLGLKQGRSCLDMSPVGHDDTDGDPAAVEEYHKLVNHLGFVWSRELRHVVIEQQKPRRMDVLLKALDAVAGA